jgi:hypothetical protein
VTNVVRDKLWHSVEQQPRVGAFSVSTQCMVATVRAVHSREECHGPEWSHVCKSFKRTGVRTNGLLECRILSSLSAGFCRKTRTVPSL